MGQAGSDRDYLFGSGEIAVFKETIIRWREGIAAILMKYMVKETF